jgi:hypothetical protein
MFLHRGEDIADSVGKADDRSSIDGNRGHGELGVARTRHDRDPGQREQHDGKRVDWKGHEPGWTAVPYHAGSRRVNREGSMAGVKFLDTKTHEEIE